MVDERSSRAIAQEVTVEVQNLPPGVRASDEADCIRIQELPDGRFALTGSVLLQCGDVEAAESVSLIGGEPYRSYEDAEAAGIAWAGEHCAETLYVSRSHGKALLEDVP